MKLRLKSKNIVPYGGTYEINRPDLGMIGKGNTWLILVNRIVEYRHANGIPVGLGFEDELEQHICALYPSESEGFDNTVPRPRNLSLNDVLLGTRTMLAFKLAGSPLVDRAEAERRAAICIDCPWNAVFAKPCSGICAELLDMVKSITGVQGTPYDMSLKSCSICSCFLQASIWIPLNIQIPPLSDDQKAQFETVQHCWKKQSLMNL